MFIYVMMMWILSAEGGVYAKHILLGNMSKSVLITPRLPCKNIDVYYVLRSHPSGHRQRNAVRFTWGLQAKNALVSSQYLIT